MLNKIITAAADAVRPIHDGAVILCGGFASCGFADELLEALHAQGTRNLTLVANNPQVAERGMALLLRDGRVATLVCSYSRKEGTTLIEDMLQQGLQLEIVPQGTLAERIRCRGAGIPGFYTRTGVGTPLAEGKEHRDFDGETHIFEFALKADFAFVRAKCGDRWGNLTYDKTARNFNAVMAMGGTHTIAQVDNVVELGALDAEAIVTPGIFVKQIVATRQP
ncbi:MAG TPA: 3-oxoacid CoA-transferase subunit A [Candidatus Acidoferrum sp.]|nr:3-oxoacid CoA-transferase subunit A [Candidatus Acidoferrum sp.]